MELDREEGRTRMRCESGFSFEVMWSAMLGLSWEKSVKQLECLRGVYPPLGALVIVVAVSELGMGKKGFLW